MPVLVTMEWLHHTMVDRSKIVGEAEFVGRKLLSTQPPLTAIKHALLHCKTHAHATSEPSNDDPLSITDPWQHKRQACSAPVGVPQWAAVPCSGHLQQIAALEARGKKMTLHQTTVPACLTNEFRQTAALED